MKIWDQVSVLTAGAAWHTVRSIILGRQLAKSAAMQTNIVLATMEQLMELGASISIIPIGSMLTMTGTAALTQATLYQLRPWTV